MTIALAITGYLVCGLITGRILAVIEDRDECSDDTELVALFGLLGWPLVAVFGVFCGTVRLMTWRLPQERHESKEEKLRERELGSGDV